MIRIISFLFLLLFSMPAFAWNGHGYDPNNLLFIPPLTGNYLDVIGTEGVGLGTASPNHTLDVGGNIGIKTSGYINFSSTDGVSGYGIRDNAGTVECKNSGGSWAACAGGGSSQWTTSGSDIYYTTGKVSIGTTTPVDTLTVNGGAVNESMVVQSSNTTATSITLNNTSSHSWDISADGSAGAAGCMGFADNTQNTGPMVLCGASKLLAILRAGVFGWSTATGFATGTVDAGISRDSADVLDFGNGTQGDKTAQLNAQSLVIASATSPGGDSFYKTGTGTPSISASGVKAVEFDTLASGVNFLSIYPNTTGNGPVLVPGGTDTNSGLYLVAKGNGSVYLKTGGLVNQYVQAEAINLNTTVDWPQFQGGVTGNPASVTVQAGGGPSADANINLILKAKGLGAIVTTGHIASSGIAPAVSACGGSPSIDANSTDSYGTVTAGTAATSCTITFNVAYVSYVHCRVTAQTALTGLAYSYSTSVITVSATGLGGDLIDYSCDGK